MTHIGVPGLAKLSSKTGVGRVIRTLEAHSGKNVVLSDLIYQSLDLPFMRNFPTRVLNEKLDAVIFPQLTGVRNVRILRPSLKSVAIVHDIGIIDSPLDKNLLNPMSKAIIKYGLKSLKHIDLIISVSEFTKQRIVKYFPNLESKIVVVNNSLSESFLNFDVSKTVSKENVCNKLAIDIDSIILLYVGTELPRKNLPLLLDTFVELKKTINKIVLIKVGGSGGIIWRQQILRLIKERSLDLEKDIYIRDNISEEDLLNYYNSATITVLPSLYEGFGLPAIESMALGTPIVAANGSAMNELVSPLNMIHTPSVESFRDAIIEIITSGVTDKQRAGMAQTKFIYSPLLQSNTMFLLIDKLVSD